MEPLLSLLTADSTDGDGKTRWALNPIHGADRLARFFVGFCRRRRPERCMAFFCITGSSRSNRGLRSRMFRFCELSRVKAGSASGVSVRCPIRTSWREGPGHGGGNVPCLSGSSQRNSMDKRLQKRHKRQVLRARAQVKLSEPDVRTPEQQKSDREASRPAEGSGSAGSAPALRSRSVPTVGTNKKADG